MKDRSDMAEDMPAKPYTETDDPYRAKERQLHMDPKRTKSSKLKELLSLAIP